ncbi:hypothetical protein DCC79_14865 [bacterium]|nr:hypothetical protein [Chloroflexi bacterium CFX6]RIL07320.1 MAG: hypothetical protein DCC79_14865 [bacterium]
MRTNDRFLLGILVGVVLLVVAAFAVVLSRSEPAYRADDSPAAVAHNYLLALQRGDYERAYGYLSPTLAGRPASVEDFVEDTTTRIGDNIADAEVAIGETTITGEVAVVKVRQSTFYSGGLFDSGLSATPFSMTLRRGESGWRITRSEMHWYQCWEDPDLDWCREPEPVKPVAP